MSMIDPVGPRLLVLPKEKDEYWDKESTLVKPDTAKERPEEGTVLAVGPGVKDTRLVIGANVLYGKFSGSEMRVDGIECLILLEDDVLGKVNPDVTFAQTIEAAGRKVPKPTPNPLTVEHTRLVSTE